MKGNKQLETNLLNHSLLFKEIEKVIGGCVLLIYGLMGGFAGDSYTVKWIPWWRNKNLFIIKYKVTIVFSQKKKKTGNTQVTINSKIRSRANSPCAGSFRFSVKNIFPVNNKT